MVRNMKKRNSGTQPEPNNNYRTTKNIGIDWMYCTPSFLRNQELLNQRLHFVIVLSYSPASILQFWQGSYPFKICSRVQRSYFLSRWSFQQYMLALKKQFAVFCCATLFWLMLVGSIPKNCDSSLPGLKKHKKSYYVNRDFKRCDGHSIVTNSIQFIGYFPDTHALKCVFPLTCSIAGYYLMCNGNGDHLTRHVHHGDVQRENIRWITYTHMFTCWELPPYCEITESRSS